MKNTSEPAVHLPHLTADVFYLYTDTEGHPHIVDALDLVPEAMRQSVRQVILESGKAVVTHELPRRIDDTLGSVPTPSMRSQGAAKAHQLRDNSVFVLWNVVGVFLAVLLLGLSRRLHPRFTKLFIFLVSLAVLTWALIGTRPMANPSAPTDTHNADKADNGFIPEAQHQVTPAPTKKELPPAPTPKPRELVDRAKEAAKALQEHSHSTLEEADRIASPPSQ